MVSLVMYSDQVIPENNKVDARLLDLLAGRGKHIGYVPSGPEPDRRYYRERQDYYSKLDLDLSVFVDMSGPLDKVGLTTLLDCDAIHLSGGGTTAFLHLLRANGLLGALAEWTRNGGLLIGTSAGAILMTPTVALDAIFSGEDPRIVRDSGALDLVPFEFFPHLNKRADYLPQLLAYSAETSRRIAACRDGDGVVVDGDVVENVGDIVWIANGAICEPLAMVR
ncbi:MAG: Type 1 glutamine amidotransferase-like domain-containing protein [Planctomycetales bacterium]|nr:Type 1 glutamine amidotransferase-like domain-containing protein [Planctomycetales bacterium]MCC0025187.1 Type 1 glutamine amidotransferase-like domain-containing protein [Hyphomicrobiaceae bacterium]